jgi:fatty acid desaturase
MVVYTELSDEKALQATLNRELPDMKAHLPTSMAYLLRDVLYCASVAWLTWKAIEHEAPMTLVYPMYSLAMGTVLTGIWVLGHECGHGAFAQTTIVNDCVGYVLHSALLVPYFSWKFSHAKHHRHTNDTIRGESHVPSVNDTPTRAVHRLLGDDAFAVVNVLLHLMLGWPLYLLLNVTGGREAHDGARFVRGRATSHFNPASQVFPPCMRSRVFASTAGCGAVATVLTLTDAWFWYAGPYLITNAWLVLYTWLQHTHPLVPHHGTPSFLKGALCTVDRPYPALIDHLHHQIGSTHVLHHIRSKTPHYHARSATRVLRDILEDHYLYDSTPILRAMWETAHTCHYIDGVHGTQYYRSFAKAKKM